LGREQEALKVEIGFDDAVYGTVEDTADGISLRGRVDVLERIVDSTKRSYQIAEAEVTAKLAEIRRDRSWARVLSN
jgi:hypothetical protein